MATVEMNGNYGYVVLVAASLFVLNMYMAFQVGKARKRYNVPYPALYAVEGANKDAKAFNCVQRGHQNTLEYVPFFITLLLLGGLKFPVAAASLGALYVVSRYFYFKGYATGNPDKRYHPIGNFGFPALVGLWICTITFGVGLLV